MRSRLPGKLADGLVMARIPFDLIAGVMRIAPDQLAIKKALGNLCTVVPAGRHFNLVSMPFVRVGADCAQPLMLDLSNWNTVVREILIDGGSLGRDLGAIWEIFLAGKLERGGWTVIGRNLRLKVNGRVLTDIDIGLLRGDILLLAQVKAVTGSAVNTYDHWRNRNIIEKGCHQARLAADLLRKDPRRLTSLTNRNVAAGIRHIEPVVFTNCTELDRWECERVVVLGPAGMTALVEGAGMSYVLSDTGAVLQKSQFAPPGLSDTESVLWILHNSLEPLICPEDGRVGCETAEFQGVRWQIPTFIARW
jgi:hypothetical protein